jgi:hypothetical protein
MLFNEMKTIKEKVEFLLVNYPLLRDDDFRLISNYFAFLMKDKMNNMSAKTFYNYFLRVSSHIQKVSGDADRNYKKKTQN